MSPPALGVDVGSALIALTRVVYDADGPAASSISHALYRPDRYAFRMDLVRTGGDDGAPLGACRAAADRTPTPRRQAARPENSSGAAIKPATERGDSIMTTTSQHVRPPPRLAEGRRRRRRRRSPCRAYLRAQAAAVKLGILQPVTGALAQDGEYGQLGAELAIKAINAAGGIKSLGGAKLEMVFGDARSKPEGGTAEVERMQAEGVVAIVGGFASPICLAATQAASRYDLPYIVDVGVSRPDRHRAA